MLRVLLEETGGVEWTKVAHHAVANERLGDHDSEDKTSQLWCFCDHGGKGDMGGNRGWLSFFLPCVLSPPAQ